MRVGSVPVLTASGIAILMFFAAESASKRHSIVPECIAALGLLLGLVAVILLCRELSDN